MLAQVQNCETNKINNFFKNQKMFIMKPENDESQQTPHGKIVYLATQR